MQGLTPSRLEWQVRIVIALAILAPALALRVVPPPGRLFR